ncbi:DNA methyltransferase [Desulfovibrio sp.]|uniref:DNA methyltransferase n=1 Tax=Desulfovibrio sp. TaxID=885 RepID=UPI003D0EFEEE
MTSKPVALMHDLLAITRPGGTVLDPFMGGGAVGVACAESNRGYIGIELSADYYGISRDRITQAK